jgi:mRNA interferase RelE/StbE
MKVRFTKRFSAQLDNLRDEALLEKVSNVVQTVMSAANIQSVPNTKKLKGHHFAYRIRIGDYRIGVCVESAGAVFAILAHRKDIYNRFP